MCYRITSSIGFVTHEFHTCESEVKMIVYVVTTVHGHVLGAYTTLKKAQARQELHRRSDAAPTTIYEVEVNEDGTQ